MKVSAVIVTRGDVDLTKCISTFVDERFVEVVVWNNGTEKCTVVPLGPGWPVVHEAADMAVYGRYAATRFAASDVIYVQDDDCVIDATAILDAYEPGRIVANMPESRWADYPDSTMVGWGAVFDRLLPWAAFGHFLTLIIERDLFGGEGGEDAFNRCCDVVFSTLIPRTVIDVGFEHLPWAETAGRMFKQPGHKEERDEFLRLARSIRIRDDDRRVPA